MATEPTSWSPRDFVQSPRDFVRTDTYREALRTTEFLKSAVASFSLLGVGCSTGYYLAPAGFFQHKFESNTFFLWMITALCIPFPIVLVLQEKFDEHFDSLFGPRQTYFFRVIAVQIILAAVFAGYALSCESEVGVLVCGVFIGSFSAAVMASTMQLMSAWDPPLTAWASVGKDIAGAMPVLTYYMLSFSASTATVRQFQTMQLFPIVLICICAVCCTGLHSLGIWDKAYARLGYDLWDVDSEEGQKRQITETEPLLAASEVDSSGQPLWTPRWQFAAGYGSFMSFMLLPLVTSMGNPDLTQSLSLGKLAMDCLSRCLAALMAKTHLFGRERPSHYLLIALMLVRTILYSLLMARILHIVMLPVNIFVGLFLLFYFIGGFLASQIDVTIVRFAPVALRKSISRRGMLVNYSGLVLSLSVDLFFIFVG